MLSPEALETLDETEKRHERNEKRLSEPEITSEDIVKLSKEISEISETVELYRRYKDIRTQIEENTPLLENTELAELAQTEIEQLERESGKCEGRIMELLTPKDPNDEKNIILEIRPGTGGEEAALFASDLLGMYSKFCEKNGWTLTLISLNEMERGGIREVVATVEGKNVFENLKHESGVHRVQRVPTTETGGRIHTSTATVAVLAEPEDVDVEIDEKDLKIDTYKASGPGGQHVNKTDSAVRITHTPSGIVVQCQSERSQHKNRAQTMRMMRAKLYELETEKQEIKRAGERKKQVGGGERSEKIRTYNFPQSRVTDHRIGFTLSNIDTVMNGGIEKIISMLKNSDAAAGKIGH
ncbi:MAG: peptide chain release factor 1 [Candidatus Mycalebacterium zealandia]|nr:MAG: peptide chain release factor 1 [Candidatus Mycalebacterium zealandia]